MKQPLLLVGVLITLLLTACQPSEEKLGDFALLPFPQQFEINGVSNLNAEDIKQCYLAAGARLPTLGTLLEDITPTEQAAEAQIIAKIDPDLATKPEGYELDIEATQIEMTAKDQAGLLYAFMTLEQLLEDATEQEVALPICTIKDEPALAFRAIHIDVKHHLEQTDYYYQLMDELAQWKINGVILEIEDKLQYQRQSKVGSADALSIATWKELSDYAKARNIEISPLVQGLGHASFILKHDEYEHLRDDPSSDWAFNPLLPETYEVQFDLYRDAIEATPHGKYLHVGGDEVHTTGGNSGKSALELQLIWLNKVCAFAAEQGRTPIFWDDMPLKEAGVYRSMFNREIAADSIDRLWAANEGKLSAFLDQFPKNCIYMRWNYSSPETAGNRKAMEWFTSNGLQVMGATAGQTRWTLMPQQESNMDAIRSFADISIESNSDGLLLTLWDDDSPHFELYKRGIAAFAEYTWKGVKRDKAAIKSDYRHRAFSSTLADTSFAFIDELEQPVAYWKNAFLQGNQRNFLQSMNDPISEALMELPNENQPGEWTEKYADRLATTAEIAAICGEVTQKITQAKAQAIRNTYRLEVYEQVNQMTAFTAKVLLTLQEYDNATTEVQRSALQQRIQQLPDEFQQLRTDFEQVYSQTRKLYKPENYILDQDHHVHLANQSRNFDWQFYAEQLMMEQLNLRFSE